MLGPWVVSALFWTRLVTSLVPGHHRYLWGAPYFRFAGLINAKTLFLFFPVHYFLHEVLWQYLVPAIFVQIVAQVGMAW